MFDFSWSELMVIGAVALVVIGPKDLPKALKTAGTVLRRARGMAREFQNSIDDMIREADLEDVRKTVQDATRFDLETTIHKTIDPEGVLKQPLMPESPPPPHLPAPPAAIEAPTAPAATGADAAPVVESAPPGEAVPPSSIPPAP